jgi:hypothetical protein
MGSAEPRAKKGPKDSRLEDDRKRDARPAVEAMGWVVLDFEQGYRPDACPACKERLPGGHSTRVPTGIADWLCMKAGKAKWIEWKVDGKNATPQQRAFGKLCAEHGIKWRVCRNTEEAVAFLKE